jgi:hypothetical protein
VSLSRQLIAIPLAWLCATMTFAQVEEEAIPCADTGTFHSSFGFSLQIPPGLTGCLNSPAGLQRHGVIIPLDSGANTSWIECYTGYADYSTVTKALDFWIRTAEAKREGLTVLSRKRAKLAGLPAERVVLAYKNASDQLERKKEMIASLRVVKNSQGGEITIEYLADLETTASRYAVDRRTYEKLLSSWKLEPSVDGP